MIRRKRRLFVDGDGDGEYLIISNGCLGFYLDALYRSVFFSPLLFSASYVSESITSLFILALYFSEPTVSI